MCSSSPTSGPGGGDQLAERRSLEVADGAVEARDDPRRVLDLGHLSDRQPGGGRDLLVRRVTSEPGRELAVHPRDLALVLLDVGREADDPRLGGEAALDRLADPQRRVGREPKALAPVELLRGANQPEHPLLDEVQQGHLRRHLVALGDRDDEAQVVVDELLLGREVAALDALGQLELLGTGQQRAARRLAQELAHRVDRVRHEVVVGVAGRRDGELAAVVLDRDAALGEPVAEVLDVLVVELQRLDEPIDLRLAHAASLLAASRAASRCWAWTVSRLPSQPSSVVDA